MQNLLNFLPILLVLSFYGARLKEVGTKRVVVSGPVQEKITFWLFMLSGLVAVFGGLLEFGLRGMQWHWPMLMLGIISAFSSFKIRRAAIEALGKFWSLHIEIRKNHEFVKSGPFRWMRHPTYFSMILELASAPLMLGTYFTGAAAFLIFVPALILRLTKEEKAMVIKFGDEYRKYQIDTPVIFPKITR